LPASFASSRRPAVCERVRSRHTSCEEQPTRAWHRSVVGVNAAPPSNYAISRDAPGGLAQPVVGAAVRRVSVRESCCMGGRRARQTCAVDTSNDRRSNSIRRVDDDRQRGEVWGPQHMHISAHFRVISNNLFNIFLAGFCPRTDPGQHVVNDRRYARRDLAIEICRITLYRRTKESFLTDRHTKTEMFIDHKQRLFVFTRKGGEDKERSVTAE
jgi:hypothetical protein